MQQLRNIKFKDTATGKSYQMPWNSPDEPTDDDIDKFVYEQEKAEALKSVPSEPTEEKQSLWRRADNPLTTAFSRGAKKLSNYINPDDPKKGREIYTPRGVISAGIESLGNVADSLTSPKNIVTTALTGGAGLARGAAVRAATAGAANAGKVARAARILNTGDKIANATVGIEGGLHGLEGVREGDAVKAVTGLTQGVLGAVGYRSNVKNAKALDALNPSRPVDVDLIESAGIAKAVKKGGKAKAEAAPTKAKAGQKVKTPTSEVIVEVPSAVKAVGEVAPAGKNTILQDVEAAVAKVRSGESVVGPKLPTSLKGSTPRFGKNEVIWESDLDLAAYIIGKKDKLSKHDAQYLKFVQDHTGLDEVGARALGVKVKDAVGTLPVKDGVINVPRLTKKIKSAVEPVEAIGTKPKVKLSATKPDELQLIKPTKAHIKQYTDNGYTPIEVGDGYVTLKKPTAAKPISDADGIIELHGGFGLPKPPKRAAKPVKNVTSTGPAAAKKMSSTQAEALSIIRSSIRGAKPMRGRMTAMQGRETARRIGEASKVPGKGEAALYQKLGKLKGPKGQIRFTSVRPQLKQRHIDSLFTTVWKSKLMPYEQIKAAEGLAKLLGERGGIVPQRRQLELLDEVFGKGFGKEIQDLHGGFGAVTTDSMTDLFNAPKALVASVDMSAPLRQGLGRIHTKEFWGAIPSMVRSWSNKEYFETLMESIHKNPNYEIARNYGLSLADREELFASHLTDAVPLVLRSGRAYTGFLNKLRMDTFSSMMDDIRKVAGTAEEADQLLAEAAEYVNTVTGRGSLGDLLNPAAEALNVGFFSPRLIASRVHMLNPKTYLAASPLVRKEYIKSAAAILGFGTAALKLGETFLGGEIETDPRSSDFGKLKIGNTRIDPWGGFQQYIVLASRLASGSKKSPTGKITTLGEKFGNKTGLDTVLDFGIGKTSPMVALVATMLRGKNFEGQPTDLTEEGWKLITPLIIQDIKEVYDDDPQSLPLEALGAFFGMGIQTYDKKKKFKKPKPKESWIDERLREMEEY